MLSHKVTNDSPSSLVSSTSRAVPLASKNEVRGDPSARAEIKSTSLNTFSDTASRELTSLTLKS